CSAFPGRGQAPPLLYTSLQSRFVVYSRGGPLRPPWDLLRLKSATMKVLLANEDSMSQVVALVDANNFYCSCERAFNAALHGKPVIVLSNNDGCVVARSNEVKPFIKMGQPVFECQELIQQHHIQVFSSNYALYADVSARAVDWLLWGDNSGRHHVQDDGMMHVVINPGHYRG
ncbi:MAG TPA: hypothetical protein VIY29_26530, partial [Ktedonobacteraceae bacterium]